MGRTAKPVPFKDTVERLLTAAAGAVRELDDLLLDDDSTVRLRAAAELLKNSTRAYELFELTKRIEALEAKRAGPPLTEEATDGDGDDDRAEG